MIILGVFLLLKAAAVVSEDTFLGWILVVFGLFLLGNGIRATAGGTIAVLRYFVGCNHPTSLAANFSRSEASTAKEESGYVAYTKQQLTEMLFGRKNATFVEPHGFLARSVHSLFPRLTYMPYPIRNMAQRLFGAWVATLTALVAYALVLTLYLLVIWRSVGASIKRTADRDIAGMGGAELVPVIGGAIVLPVVISVGLSFVLKATPLSTADLKATLTWLPEPHTLLYLTGILLGAIISTVVIVVMLRKRLAHSDPRAEVSERRENWQESVHPNEIFINLDNLVMANRRHKEVPNRVYQELEPSLNEQVEGKGSFRGEMIQEIQPKFSAMDLGVPFRQARLASLLSGNLLFVVATILTVFLAFAMGDAYLWLSEAGLISTSPDLSGVSAGELVSVVSPVVHLFLAGIVVRAFAGTLANAAGLKGP